MKAKQLIYMVSILTALLNLNACDRGCETIANADWPAFLQVENELDSSMTWHMDEYAFTAEMKKGECTIFGLNTGTHIVKLSGCTTHACRSLFVVNEEFTVGTNDTHVIQVNSDYVAEKNEIPDWIEPVAK